jgi:D-alanyl-D-alanine carboxypeptidase (penicillin-binding protein 5/6)
MFRRHFAFIAGAVLVSLSLSATQPAAALETSAREAFIMDMSTHTVLLAKDADALMPPASMSKIMTVYLVFEALHDGRLKLTDELPVSEKAWRMGGSKMFVEVGNRVPVEDLLQGVIVQSGNDACIVLAEALAGSEEAFAEMMTKKARDLGLTKSHFANATGWPNPGHYMTARELALLARHLITDFPEYYKFFSELEFTWNGIKQHNRNPLLYRTPGADGLKTGHTEEAGYGLTASVERDGRRIVLVLNGLESNRARAEESERLVEWAFREFDSYTLFKKGEAVESAEVWMGEEDKVPLVADKDVKVTLPKRSRDDLKVTVKYEGPIPAPITEGQKIAELKIEAGEMEPIVIPLYAGRAVEEQGAVGRFFTGVKHLIIGSAAGVE